MLKVENYGIKEIDDLPQKNRNIDLINLNQNCIKSLRGITQFTSLKKLIVSNNEVYSLKANQIERYVNLDIEYTRSLLFNGFEKS